VHLTRDAIINCVCNFMLSVSYVIVVSRGGSGRI